MLKLAINSVLAAVLLALVAAYVDAGLVQLVFENAINCVETARDAVLKMAQDGTAQHVVEFIKGHAQ